MSVESLGHSKGLKIQSVKEKTHCVACFFVSFHRKRSEIPWRTSCRMKEPKNIVKMRKITSDFIWTQYRYFKNWIWWETVWLCVCVVVFYNYIWSLHLMNGLDYYFLLCCLPLVRQCDAQRSKKNQLETLWLCSKGLFERAADICEVVSLLWLQE